MTSPNSVTGSEGLLDNLGKLFGVGSDNTLKGITSEVVLKGISNGATEANRLIAKAIGANNHLISSYLSNLDKLKSSPVKISKGILGGLTTDGDVNHLKDDLVLLSKVLTIITKHQGDVEAHLSQRLTVMKKIVNLKDTQSIVDELDKLTDFTPPEINFGKRNEKGTETVPLPNGKMFVYESGESPKYFMESIDQDLEEVEHEFTSNELKEFLNALRDLNKQYQSLGQMIKRYSDYVSSWTNVVKSLQSHLDKQNELSSSVKNRVFKEMTLEPTYLNFYTVFLPRISGYVNDCIVAGTKLADQLL